MSAQPTAHFPDLSHYEPNVDFHVLVTEGVPLVITKCTEGQSYVDPTYENFAKRIHATPGMILGAYVFEDVGDAKSQNSHFLSAAHLGKGDLQPVLDAEALGLSKDQTFEALRDFERRGYRPILYCNLSFFRDVLGSPLNWWLWLAAYTKSLPKLATGVKLFAWQHTDSGVYKGVAKPCDSSYLYVSIADLKAKFLI